MSREILKEHYEERILKQIKEKEPKMISLVYEHLLEIGYNEDRAVEAIAFKLETYETFVKKRFLDQWNHNLKEMMKEKRKDGIVLALDSIAHRIKDMFHNMQDWEERGYEIRYKQFEGYLSKMIDYFNFEFDELKKMIEIWMYMTFGDIYEITYTFSLVANEDVIGAANCLFMISNPFDDKTLIKMIETEKPDIDFHRVEVREKMLRINFFALTGVYDHMNEIEKESGKDAYIDYLLKNYVEKEKQVN